MIVVIMLWISREVYKRKNIFQVWIEYIIVSGQRFGSMLGEKNGKKVDR